MDRTEDFTDCVKTSLFKESKASTVRTTVYILYFYDVVQVKAAHEVQFLLRCEGMDLALCRTTGIRGRKGLSNVPHPLLPRNECSLYKAFFLLGHTPLTRPDRHDKTDRQDRLGHAEEERREEKGRRPRCSTATGGSSFRLERRSGENHDADNFPTSAFGSSIRTQTTNISSRDAWRDVKCTCFSALSIHSALLRPHPRIRGTGDESRARLPSPTCESEISHNKSLRLLLMAAESVGVGDKCC